MICKSKKIDENEVYNKAKKLLEIYRDVCWETSEYADQVRENLMVDYGYMSGDLDTALVYLENFAPDEKKERFAARIQSLFDVKWMVEIVDSAMIKVREFPLNGDLYSQILSMYYLGRFQYTEAEMMEELCLERSSYYRRKKEAVMVFGLTIWGGALDDFRQIMIVNEPTQMSIYRPLNIHTVGGTVYMALRNTVRSFFHWTGTAGERMEVMATNKETMNVIAKGMEKEVPDRELIELNEMTFDIAATLAYQMSDRFMRIARKLEMESVKAIVYVLEHLDTEQAVAALQAIFYSHGMVEAAQEMELLDICSACMPSLSRSSA